MWKIIFCSTPAVSVISWSVIPLWPKLQSQFCQCDYKVTRVTMLAHINLLCSCYRFCLVLGSADMIPLFICRRWNSLGIPCRATMWEALLIPVFIFLYICYMDPLFVSWGRRWSKSPVETLNKCPPKGWYRRNGWLSWWNRDIPGLGL